MNLKLGLNIQTLIIAAIAVWLVYGSFQGGKIYQNELSDAYGAKTS